jgi:predicted nucleotide-binding protein
MSLAIFYEDLESILHDVSKSVASLNALSGIPRVNLREVNERFTELLKDASDWSRSNGKIDLAIKLEEIIGEDKFHGVDSSQLEAKVRRSMRAFRTFGKFSPEDQYSKEIARDEKIRLESAKDGSGVMLPSKQPHKVFVVHGHDESMLHQVMRLLNQVGLEGIVLREQPSEGRAVIEKLEHYSEVGFAVILMTADDMGGSAESASKGEYRPRARQNVVLELGFFAAKLSRRRLCVLKESGVEEPSDILGIVYTDIDRSGAWRLTLGKELKAAGFEVDLNKL